MKYVRKRRGSPKAILDQLYAELVATGAKHGTLIDKRRFDAWVCRSTDVATRQAVAAWVWALENHGMIRQTSDGRIRFLNPPDPQAPFEPLVPGRKRVTDGAVQQVAARFDEGAGEDRLDRRASRVRKEKHEAEVGPGQAEQGYPVRDAVPVSP